MRKLCVSLSFSLFLLLLTCFSSVPAKAKAAYATRLQMVKRAVAIAVVDIGPVADCKLKGKYWTYSQTAQAEVQQTLKGVLPASIQLVAQENFECAQTRLTAGKCLVFLTKVDGLPTDSGPWYSGCNWQASLCPVKASGQVDWLLEPGACFSKGQVTLAQALKQVQSDLEQVR